MLSKFSNKRSLSGFTIIELLVAMAVASVLLGLALPAFDTFIEQRNMTSRVNGFISAVNLARSEAVNRGGDVSIQAMNAGDNGNEWGAGLLRCGRHTGQLPCGSCSAYPAVR